LIALYEGDVPFEKELVDLSDPAVKADFLKLTPLGRFPVVVDEESGRGFPESSIIIEYLAIKYPSAARLIPQDRDLALRVRLSDRFYDNYVHNRMQSIVNDRLRPEDKRDAHGVAIAREQLDSALSLVDRDMESGGWATGLTFTLADCAAAPALYYADQVMPLAEKHAAARRYLDRLMARPSFARCAEGSRALLRNVPQKLRVESWPCQTRQLHHRTHVEGAAQARLRGVGDGRGEGEMVRRDRG